MRGRKFGYMTSGTDWLPRTSRRGDLVAPVVEIHHAGSPACLRHRNASLRYN